MPLYHQAQFIEDAIRSDDWYEPGERHAVAVAYVACPRVDVGYGHSRIVDPAGIRQRFGAPGKIAFLRWCVIIEHRNARYDREVYHDCRDD